MSNHKLIRITTVPISLDTLLNGQLKFMQEQGFDVIGVSSPGEELDRVHHRQKVKTVAIPMTRVISPIRDIKALWQLYRLFKKEKPEIVHSHTPKAGLLGMIAAKAAGVPFRLHTIAGLPLLVATGIKRRVLNQTEKLTYACATNVYPNSFGLEKIVVDHKLTNRSKLKIIGQGSSNGIDTAAFNPAEITEDTKATIRKELGITKDAFIFLFVGRVVTDKGINELVQAFWELINQNPNSTNPIHLIIVGNYESHLDPLLPETEKIIEKTPNIHAVGYKSNVIDYFAIADVLTFPSYREGFPNVVMQAAAMQLNAIVTDINGCNEIVTHGDNGWIVPVKNIEKLKNRMQWCLENRKESKNMGIKSRRLMQDHYERQFIWEELLREYKRLVRRTTTDK